MTPTQRKVLVVASTFPAGPEDSVPRFVWDQVAALKAARPNYSFIVLAPHDSRSSTKSFQDHGYFREYRFHYLWPNRLETLAGHGILPAIQRNPLQVLAVPLLLYSEFRAVHRIVKTEDPDLIYAHWFTPQVVTCAPIARRSGIPLVFTTHASDVSVWARFGTLGRCIVRSATASVSRFTAVSNASLNRMRPFFRKDQWTRLERRTKIIPMGVELPNIADETPRTVPTSVLFIGRLAEKKGVDRLLKSFAEIHRSQSAARLVIAGDGPMRASLETMASSLHISDVVTFVGYQTGIAKDSLYRSADICVLPSVQTGDGDTEGLPVSLLEALSYGKPTVATTSTNAGEIVQSDIDALICPPDDVRALSAAILKLMTAKPTELDQIAQNARRTAENFAWTSIAERTASFLLDPFLADPGVSKTKGPECAS